MMARLPLQAQVPQQNGVFAITRLQAICAKGKTPPASILSSDLHITGNIKTTGDIQVEGTVEGDIRAHLLTIGETATIKGELTADDVIVNGRIVGRVRGIKVRLTASARVEGDIIHKTIAIESGAHFEGICAATRRPFNWQNQNSSRKTTVDCGIKRPVALQNPL